MCMKDHLYVYQGMQTMLGPCAHIHITSTYITAVEQTNRCQVIYNIACAELSCSRPRSSQPAMDRWLYELLGSVTGHLLTATSHSMHEAKLPGP